MAHNKKSKALSRGIPPAPRPVHPSPVPGAIQFEERSVSFHQGPLPPASELERYGACVPGGAERIFAMAEAQSATRLKLETAMVEANNALLLRGQIFGFILGVVGIVSGATVIALGHSVAGTILSGSSLCSLVGLFLYANKKKSPPSPPRTPVPDNFPSRIPSE